jgi:hypothetical protein
MMNNSRQHGSLHREWSALRLILCSSSKKKVSSPLNRVRFKVDTLLESSVGLIPFLVVLTIKQILIWIQSYASERIRIHP